MGSPLLPSSLIFEKFEKSVAVPDMAPEPLVSATDQENDMLPDRLVWQQGPASFNIMDKTDVCTLLINTYAKVN